MSAGSSLVGVLLEAETLASALERQRDYRVLRRLQTMCRSEQTEPSAVALRGVCIDVETTGLDRDRDSIIELAVQSFGVDSEGRIVTTGEPFGWLEDPGLPLSESIGLVTGLHDEDLRGRRIDDEVACKIIGEADVVVAHNAAFDCPFVERRFPSLQGMPWVCTLNGVDWRAEGFEGRTLSQLCVRLGWFYDAHRAGVDVTALLHLVDHELDDGRTVFSRLYEKERRSTWRIEAVGAPFASKDMLKGRGYRWDANRRLWWCEVPDHELEQEVDWATINVYDMIRAPETTRVDWTTRYSRIR